MLSLSSCIRYADARPIRPTSACPNPQFCNSITNPRGEPPAPRPHLPRPLLSCRSVPPTMYKSVAGVSVANHNWSACLSCICIVSIWTPTAAKLYGSVRWHEPEFNLPRCLITCDLHITWACGLMKDSMDAADTVALDCGIEPGYKCIYIYMYMYIYICICIYIYCIYIYMFSCCWFLIK